MKIFEIIPHLNSGGAERFVVDLCNKLVERNEALLVVLHSIDSNSYFLHELSSKVKVLSMGKKDGLSIKLLFDLTRLIYSEKPDVVHTHLNSIVYSSLSSFFYPKITFIHTVHSDASYESPGLLNTWIRKVSFSLKKIVAVTISESSQYSFKRFYHNLPSELIYNGRPRFVKPSEEKLIKIANEIQNLKYHKDAVVILNVARLNKVKNQETLSKAIVSLNNQGYHIELFNIGEFNDFDVVNAIEKLHSPFIHLLGTRMNTRDYMYLADAFCLSSVTEGMPITLIECFSVGTIPICTPVGGIKNMITDNWNGLLAESVTQQQIENVLLRFLKLSKQQRMCMKNNVLQSFSAYTMENCCYKYEKLMNGKRCL